MLQKHKTSIGDASQEAKLPYLRNKALGWRKNMKTASTAAPGRRNAKTGSDSNVHIRLNNADKSK